MSHNNDSQIILGIFILCNLSLINSRFFELSQSLSQAQKMLVAFLMKEKLLKYPEDKSA